MGVRDQIVKFACARPGRVMAVSLLAGTAVAGGAYASGLGLVNQNSDAVAHAYAGVTVENDPAISYYNPAGMVLIDGNQLEESFNIYSIHSSFSGSDNNPLLLPAVTTGSARGYLESTLVPGTFSVISLPHGIKAGLSVTVPIGGRIKYPDNFVGQFQGTEALVTTIQVGLAIAIPITSQLSIGFGPEINWFQNILSTNENLGFPVAGTFTGKGYGIGFNAGLLYQLSPETRFGLDYRSKIDQKFKGTESISSSNPIIESIFGNGPGQFPPASPAFDKWAFPQQISLGIWQQVTPRLSVMFSALWTNWAQETGLTITDPSTTILTDGAVYTPFKYRNTWTLAAGASYELTPALTLMGGAGYDESPVKTIYRQDLVPDADRTMLGCGASLQLTPAVKAVLAYQHIIVANNSISQTRLQLGTDGSLNPAGIGSGNLTGEYKTSADVFSASIIGKF